MFSIELVVHHALRDKTDDNSTDWILKTKLTRTQLPMIKYKSLRQRLVAEQQRLKVVAVEAHKIEAGRTDRERLYRWRVLFGLDGARAAAKSRGVNGIAGYGNQRDSL